MSRIMTFLQRLFATNGNSATPPGADDDHLTGAVDLSDAAYCMSLLPRDPD